MVLGDLVGPQPAVFQLQFGMLVGLCGCWNGLEGAIECNDGGIECCRVKDGKLDICDRRFNKSTDSKIISTR